MVVIMNKSILVVDDSSSIRSLVSRTLMGAGYDVDCAEDGVEAAKLARNKAYNLLLTDINMPNMDGYQLSKIFNQLPRNRETPIICLTTESSQKSKDKGREAGVSGWMVKPFSPETLVRVASDMCN